tara:strand:+ start:118999 stop:119478 length:480 start_codon:yes stop_codon:yes gene_type:complete
MNTKDIADEIWREIGQPSTESVASISYWLRTNVGNLNIALRTCFTVDNTTLEISPEINENQKYIFKQMQLAYYYGNLVRSNLGAAASSVIQITQAGKTVRKVNRNEVSKVYAQLRKETQEELDKLIFNYRKGRIVPVQVVGNDVGSTIKYSTNTNTERQ